MIDRRELIVNPEYQRGTGIWPNGARSYFIDTILTGYPFPKLYFFEYIDKGDGRRLKREIVDGQQRINTITDFHANKFAISGDSKFAGLRFSELDEDDQDRFTTYSVPVDVLKNATKANVLQMFRRMNAYTLPLNSAEKRHSGFQGEFKWFVNELTDKFDEFFVEYGVFTDRQIVRMADAELLTDIILTLEQGIVSTSPSGLRGMYEKYDDAFPHRAQVLRKIDKSINFITTHLSDLRKTHMMKPYALHMLITGLIHNRFGIEAIESQLGVGSVSSFTKDTERAAANLFALAQAHEAKEETEEYGLYVWGATTGGTNRANRRAARLMGILKALGNPVRKIKDASLTVGMPE